MNGAREQHQNPSYRAWRSTPHHRSKSSPLLYHLGATFSVSHKAQLLQKSIFRRFFFVSPLYPGNKVEARGVEPLSLRP